MNITTLIAVEKLSWFIRHLSGGLHIFYINLWKFPSDIWASPLEMSELSDVSNFTMCNISEGHVDNERQPALVQVIGGKQLTHHPRNKMAAISADNIFKYILLHENDRIQIQISLKLVPKSPIVNKPALLQVMAWCRTGDKPLPEPMMT